MTVVIPERMRHLPLDRRGYPIPVAVFRDKNDRPHFTINDDVKRHDHIIRDLCPICGDKLFRGRWFVGGPLSGLIDIGRYIDPPMHAECARYALQVCPYLAAPNYSKRIDDRTLPADETAPIMVDPTMIPERPEVFVAVMALGTNKHWITIGRHRIVQYISPVRPLRRVEFWRHGVLLSESEGREIAARARIPEETELKPPRLIRGSFDGLTQ